MKIKYWGKEWIVSDIQEFKWNDNVKFEYRNIKSDKFDVNVMIIQDKLVIPFQSDWPKIFIGLINKLNEMELKDG